MYVSDEIDPSEHYKRKAFTFPLQLLDNFDEIKWNLVHVPGINDTFYIESSLYEELLCSSDSHMDFFKMRRKLHTVKVPSSVIAAGHDTSCMWKFQNFEHNGENRFVILNVKYEEPLYAASALFKNFQGRRNVFTWHMAPDSPSFVWQVDCTAYDDA